jgi:hypothetical protein
MKTIYPFCLLACAAMSFTPSSACAQLAFSGSTEVEQPTGVFYIFEAISSYSYPTFLYFNYQTHAADFIVPTIASNGTFSGTSLTTGRSVTGNVNNFAINLTYNGTSISKPVISDFGTARSFAGHYNGYVGSSPSSLVILGNGFVYFLGWMGGQSGVGSVDGSGNVSINALSGEHLSFKFTPLNGFGTGTAQSSVSGSEGFAFSKHDIQRLVNISTRGVVQSGNHVLIGGFIVHDGVKAVVVRALGPTLSSFGIADFLPDPRVDIVQGSTVIASNADWKTNSNVAELQASGLAPPNDKEAAVLITLKPGNYTAIVSSQDSSEGVALVEVYDIK